MTATMSNPTVPVSSESGGEFDSARERAAVFAAAVRERLSDLPADELDDLLDGLQGDLTDRLADDTGSGELGDPNEYADELRQAAGLPARGEATAAKPRRGLRVAVRESWHAAGTRFAAYWDAKPSRRAVRDFVLALRPVWWVARGLVLCWMLNELFLGGSVSSLPVLILAGLLVVLSVQWGRGAWAPKRWIVWLRRAASVVAVIALVPAAEIVWYDVSSPAYVEEWPSYESGLTHEGTEIGNIFAYGCDGALLDGVQLFTRDGEPLTTLQDGEAPWFSAEDGSSYQYVQNPLVTMPTGWDGWNVFPLQWAEWSDYTGELGPTAAAEAPFERVPALGEVCSTPTGAEEGGEGSADSNAADSNVADSKTADAGSAE